REGIEILHEGKDIEIPAHTGSDLEGSGTAEIVDVVIEFDREIRVGSDQESDRQVPCPDRVARAGGLGGPGYSFADIEEGYRGWRTVLGVAKVRASRRRVERDSGPGAVIGIELIARCRLCQSLLGNENGQRQEDQQASGRGAQPRPASPGKLILPGRNRSKRRRQSGCADRLMPPKGKAARRASIATRRGRLQRIRLPKVQGFVCPYRS